VALESSVAAVVAALDLKMVRLLRRAMNGGCAPCGPIETCPADEFKPRKRHEPEPVIEPRKRIEPTPYFEPRLRIRPRPEIVSPPCAQSAPAAPVEAATRPSCPIEPPWKVLPWERGAAFPPPRPVRKIKVFVSRPDSYCKGSVLDLFI
jgi:hypothetical protein